MSESNTKRVLLGLLFIAIGSVVLLRITNLLPLYLPGALFSWKMILVILGVIFLLSERNKSTGAILLLIGAVFLASDWLNVGFWEILRVAIPLLLVLVGILMLFPGLRLFRNRRHGRTYSASSEDRLEEVCVFGGIDKRIHSDAFQGGEVTCIFGGAELHFGHSKLAVGNNLIDLTCIFSGATFHVPADWTVRLETTNIFGGFSDSRSQSVKQEKTGDGPVLVIRGLVLFGGGDIKYA